MSPPSHAGIPFGEALRFWLKLGFISFGGPAGQIAIMHQELVERRKWIAEGRFLHALNYCMLLPGPEAQQLATYMGWLMHGTKGGIAAGTLFVLPSLLILIGLSWGYVAWGTLPAVAAVLDGIKPAVVAIVLVAALRIGRRVLKRWPAWAVAAAAFAALVAGAPFPALVLGAALVGAACALWAPSAFPTAHAHGEGDVAAAPWHGPGAPLRKAIVGLAIGAAALGLCVAVDGWGGTLTDMALFFTKAALLTFGGAYAVLPYVFEAAVEHYAWLSAAQMIDGLALGETTPGPLIMVVAFIGFVGGAEPPLLGPGSVAASGALAACVATFFTFLPSFLFVLAGAPLVEATHGRSRLAAPLAAITAAVVGVIVHLGVMLAGHVMWPVGFAAAPDWASVAIGVAALVGLASGRVGIIPTIAAAGLAGLAIGSV